MKLSLVTVAFDPETGTFPIDPLNGIAGEILSVVEHFFYFEGLPRLLLVIQHRPPQTDEPEKRGIRGKRPDPRDELSDEEARLFGRLSGRGGRGRPWLQPGHPWRLLEERSRERAGREPQQERPGQPRRQPGFSPCELGTDATAAVGVLTAGSDESGSRTGLQYPGADQTPVLSSSSGCPVAHATGVVRGRTEAPPPGDGHPVVAGRSFRGRR